MVAALDHGSAMCPGMNMHPFFRPVCSQPDSIPGWNSSGPVIILPLSPRRETRPHHDAHIVSTEPTTSPTTASPSTATEARGLEDGVAGLPKASLNGHGPDQNFHRRKRRRLSPKGLAKLNAVAIQPDNSGAVDQISASEPPSCDVESEAGSNGLSQLPSNAKVSEDDRLEISQSTPIGALDGAFDNDRATPKKKMLRLGTNGTFTKSPKSLSKKLSPGTVPGKQSSKRVELKKGRLVSSLVVTLTYRTIGNQQRDVGEKIERILSSTADDKSCPSVKVSATSKNDLVTTSTKSTHPFFLGLLAPRVAVELPGSQANIGSSTQVSDEETTKSPIKAKAWQDIKFSSNKAPRMKAIGVVDPLWPPLNLQRVNPQEASLVQSDSKLDHGCKEKSRQLQYHIPSSEDVLQRLGSSLQSKLAQAAHIHMPNRCLLTADDLIARISRTENSSNSNRAEMSLYPAIQALRSKIRLRKSPFNRGTACDSHIWPLEYAPKTWQEVLQPKCKDLYDWLDGLKVHHVQKGVNTNHSRSNSRTRLRKKKAKRQSHDLDDFLVDSDEEQLGLQEMKNVIILVGPPGCGKTASVYAVAKQLGFEVFEINPGTRRSAKDIFDRVGDVARNHLVQRTAPPLLRALSQSKSDTGPSSSQESQVLGANHDKGQTVSKSVASQTLAPNTVKKEGTQKQSLILFEEVDLLYDDDKSFWAGVLSLAQQSRRPVVLTCNDISSVPVDQLPVYTTLEYEAPPVDLAADLLVHVAAGEGHWITHEAANSLYKSKQSDLRASLTELNFWCQMTIGSQQGGLDWMDSAPRKEPAAHVQSDIRIISKDTYFPGLDLLPIPSLESSEFLEYAQINLGQSAAQLELMQHLTVQETRDVSVLQELMCLTDARSSLDLMDEKCASEVVTAMNATWNRSWPRLDRRSVVQIFESEQTPRPFTRGDIQDVLMPLNDDYRQFPAASGRTGPSIDTTSISMLTEVVPYVRTIVSYEQQMANLQHTLDGSQGKAKKRNTRASRAALEGGNKATTRRERWFPRELDFDLVLHTGSNFVKYDFDCTIYGHESPPSTASTVDDDTNPDHMR